MTLRSKVIRLAHQKPELRPHLLPLVKTALLEKDPVFEAWQTEAPLSRPPISPALSLKMRRVLRGAPLPAVELIHLYNRLHDSSLGAPPPPEGFYPPLREGVKSILRFLPKMVGKGQARDVAREIVSTITPVFSYLKRIDRGHANSRMYHDVSMALAHIFPLVFGASGIPLDGVYLPGPGRFVGVRLNREEINSPSVPEEITSVFTPEEESLPTSTNQRTKNLDDLYEDAMVASELQLDLLNRGTGLDSRIGARVVYPGQKEDWTKSGPVVQIGPLKKKQRLIEKVTAEGSDPSSALDLVRSTVAVDTVGEIPGILRELRDMGIVFARRPKNRFSKPTALGYRDLMFNITYPNGHIGELQVNLKPMLIAKKSGHLLYEKVREIEARKKMEGSTTLTPEEQQTIDEANEASRALYEEAWRQAFGTEG